MRTRLAFWCTSSAVVFTTLTVLFASFTADLSQRSTLCAITLWPSRVTAEKDYLSLNFCAADWNNVAKVETLVCFLPTVVKAWMPMATSCINLEYAYSSESHGGRAAKMWCCNSASVVVGESLIAAMVAVAFHSFENSATFWALIDFVQLTVELIALKDIALNASQLVRRLHWYLRFFVVLLCAGVRVQKLLPAGASAHVWAPNHLALRLSNDVQVLSVCCLLAAHNQASSTAQHPSELRSLVSTRPPTTLPYILQLMKTSTYYW